ncbi:MAG: glycosyltransferase family 39 protein [Candidatus Levybacteria bacterium]|nr:glycosyltransferase family 39 protein [Candidatus Levybacteria bacterium]MDZ4227945.1 glycosyltransferase family 39 protein [Candidatus Levybacteria bacterium]
MKILKELERSRQFWFVIFIIFLFFILRLPSLFEPLWYGDEGIYQVIGTSLNHGKLLYSQIFDNKPPLLYWLYSIFQSDQFSIRLVSLVFGALSVIMFFFLSKKLFKSEKKNNIPYLTTIIFAFLFGLPVLEGNIANAENFMLLPIIASAFLLLNSQKSNPNRSPINPCPPSLRSGAGRRALSFIPARHRCAQALAGGLNHYFFAGLILGVAFLFKIVAIFDLAAFLVFCFIINFNSLKKEIKLFSIIIGFLIPISLVSVLFISNGTFMDFIKAAFISNLSYISYGNKIGSLPFLLLIKSALLGGFLFFALMKRKKINQPTLFVSIWFAFSLFNTYFSQRPYTHYLLVLIPSLSLMVGAFLFDKKYRKIIVVFFIIVLLTIAKTFGMPNFNKSINYYQNFISYVLDEKTMAQYQAFFDRNTPSDYEVARFIKPKLSKNDTIFVWGDNAQLYQLIGVVAPTKYVVAYHISNYKDGPENTRIAIEKTKPKFIVIIASNNPIPFSLIGYSSKININKATIYERVF